MFTVSRGSLYLTSAGRWKSAIQPVPFPLDCDEVMALTLTEGHSGKRGGARSWNMAAESGFYKLIARSRKASTPGTFAHRFSNWVFRDVIPSIPQNRLLPECRSHS